MLIDNNKHALHTCPCTHCVLTSGETKHHRMLPAFRKRCLLFIQDLLKMSTYGAFVLKFMGIIFAAAAAAAAGVQNNVEKTDLG